jgi:hypothetical protein
VGEGEGEGDGVAVSVASDADLDPDPLGRPSAGDPSEEPEEHDVRTANTQAATTATTAVDDVLLRSMIAIEPPLPVAGAGSPQDVGAAPVACPALLLLLRQIAEGSSAL